MAALRMHRIWFTLFCVGVYTNSITNAFTIPDGYSNCSTLVFVETLIEDLANSSEPDAKPCDWQAEACKKNNLFPCTNGNSCVPLIKICNGEDDCGDQSDEQCTGKVNINGTLWGTVGKAYEDIKEMVQEESLTDSKPIASVQCKGDELPCGNRYSCIHPSLRCDGINNCGDGSDEEGCPEKIHGNELEPKNTQQILMENECLQSTPKFQGIGCFVTGTTFKENTYVRKCNGAIYDREYILLNYLTQVEDNVTIVSKCKEGFTRNGYSDPIFRSKCQNEIWTPSIPACQATCKPFYMSDLNVECSRNNEKIDCREPFLPETTVVYSCKSNNYENSRKVTQKLTCLFSGRWDSELPDCTPYKPTQSAVSPSPRYNPTTTSTPPYPSTSTRYPTTLSSAQTVIKEVKDRCQDYSKFNFNKKASSLLKSTATCARCQGLTFREPGNVSVDNHKFPHMALLGYTDLYGYKEWFCDASLISERYVLSTADCRQTEKGKADWIKLGHPTILNNIFRVVSVIVHPAYNPLSAYNNIALFRFRGIRLYSLVVQPICLYTSNYINPSDTLIATSFVPVADIPEKPSNVSMHLDYAKCITSFKKGYEYQTSLCALPSTWTNNTQRGSPLQVTMPNMQNIWALVGISSVMPNLENTDDQQPQPIVYIKISFYLNWIAKIVWPKRAETDYYTVGS